MNLVCWFLNGCSTIRERGLNRTLPEQKKVFLQKNPMMLNNAAHRNDSLGRVWMYSVKPSAEKVDITVSASTRRWCL